MEEGLKHQRIRPAKLARRAGIIAGVFFAIWLLGYVVFAAALSRQSNVAQKADAIVVLTGGEERIKQAMALLKSKMGARLLISGVNPKTPNDDIRDLVDVPDSLFDCCVDFDRAAADTIGNAVQTANWVQEKGYGSVIIVTAYYHMPRSLLEFRRAMPDVEIVPYSISTRRFPVSHWWRGGRTARLLAWEYNKYLVSFVRTQIF